MNNFEKPNSIDELEKKLYSPNQKLVQKERKHLSQKQYDVAQDWPTNNLNTEESLIVDNEKKPNWFFRLLIIAIIFFIGTAAYVGAKFFFFSGIDASNVDILVNAPLTVGAGESFDFEVTMQNKNQLGMKFVDVEIIFPDGTRSVEDISKNNSVFKDEISSIAVGEIVKKNYSALLFGEEGDKKDITIQLQYQVEGSPVTFRKEKKFDVVLKSTPIRLTINNVKEITSGQEVTFNIELVSNSTQTLKDVRVEANYPFGFIFKNSTITPNDDKKSWIIPKLEPKETVSFIVKGTLEGQNNDERFFDFSVGLENTETKTMQVVFSKKGTTIALARPFLELDLSINQDKSEPLVVNPDSVHTVIVSYKNNSQFPIRNAKVTMKVEGESINEESIIASDGFYQSLNDTLVWDYNTNNKLSFIPVGGAGNVSFSFSGSGIKFNKLIVNPEATFTLHVEGNRNVEGQVSEMIENTLIKKIRFNTETSIASRSEYYSSIFINSGPIPPKAENKTSYTAFLSIKNSSNGITDGVVTMKLPNYVQYDGKFSPTNENVSYDPVNRILSWNVGNISAKSGYQTMPSRTIAIQVSIIPSLSQVGTSPVLIDNIRFEGIDSFTRKNITKQIPLISTTIVDSKFYGSEIVSK